MINPLVLQTFIAERLGWTDLYTAPDGTLVGIPPGSESPIQVSPPNWLDDRNATKDLPVKDRKAYWAAYAKFPEYYQELESEAHLDSALIESLIWILSEHGYRWVECAKCEDGEIVTKVVEHIAGVPGNIVTSAPKVCPDCHGDKGEFVKIEKEASGGKQKTDHS